MLAHVYAGPAPCMCLPIVGRMAKTQKGGRLTITGSIRHKDPRLCCHNALAQHLITRYTIEMTPFPDPQHAAAWNRMPLWPGNDAAKPLTYDQQRRAVASKKEDLGLTCRKQMHLFRILGANNMDMSGVEEAVCSMS